MRKYVETLAQATLLVGALYAGCMFADWVVDSSNAKRAHKANSISERGCQVSGYYGRSGEYAVYNCRGWIVKEEDL